MAFRENSFSADKAGAFDFSALKDRLPVQPKKSSFKAGTLHAEAELGDIEGIKRLLEIGLDEGKPSSMTLNQREDVMGREAIHIAAQMGHTDLVKWLITQHVNLGATDNFGVTPLHLAAQNNDVRTMEAILSARSSTVDVDHCKETPLHWAATKGCTEAVQLLIKRGSSVDPCNHPEGATPLMRAAFNGQLATVEALLDAGANLHARNRDGSTVLHQACYMNHVNIIEYLVPRCTKTLINQPNAKKQTAYDMCITDLAREALTSHPGLGASTPSPEPAPPAPQPAPAKAPLKAPEAEQETAAAQAAWEAKAATESHTQSEMERLLAKRREERNTASDFPELG